MRYYKTWLRLVLHAVLTSWLMQLILNFKIFYKAVSAQRAHSRFQGNPSTLCTPRSHPIVPSEQSWCSSVDQGSEGMPQAPSIPRSPMHSQGEPGPCPCPCTSRALEWAAHGALWPPHKTTPAPPGAENPTEHIRHAFLTPAKALLSSRLVIERCWISEPIEESF